MQMNTEPRFKHPTVLPVDASSIRSRSYDRAARREEQLMRFLTDLQRKGMTPAKRARLVENTR
jgi:hypothetical protein